MLNEPGSQQNYEVFMKIVTKAALIIGLFLTQHVLAAEILKDYDPAEVRCMTDNDSSISKLLIGIDYADKTFPNIPPEEQHYLESEYAAAAQMYKDENTSGDKIYARSSQMFNKLYSRPLYAVWDFRKTIEPARASLKRILKRQPNLEKGDADFITYVKNTEAEKLERAANAIGAFEKYNTALQKLLDKVSVMQSPLISKTQYIRLASASLLGGEELGWFISCKLSKIMGRQDL